MERHESRVKALTENENIGHYFKALIFQWEKNIDPPASSIHENENSMASINLAEKERRIRDIARRGNNRAMMDSDEENYFNEDEDDEASTSSTTGGPEQGGGAASIAPTLGLVNYSVDDDGEGDLVESVAGQEAAAMPIQSLEPLIKRKKRGADEDEDEDGDDMMGRLVKRKSSSHETDQETEGGFIKEDSDNKLKSNTAAKKFTISLSPGSENQFKKDNE